MTRRQGGDILWKGKVVENYDSPWCYSDDGKKQAEELARRCRYLESVDEEVNTHNAVWVWDEKYSKNAEKVLDVVAKT